MRAQSNLVWLQEALKEIFSVLRVCTCIPVLHVRSKPIGWSVLSQDSHQSPVCWLLPACLTEHSEYSEYGVPGIGASRYKELNQAQSLLVRQLTAYSEYNACIEPKFSTRYCSLPREELARSLPTCNSSGV
jgi:hypothetical protein